MKVDYVSTRHRYYNKIMYLLTFLIFLSSKLYAQYYDYGNGAVHDLSTNLQWQKCSLGQTSINGTCDGTTSQTSWQAALAYCEGLFLNESDDWHLPSLNELKSLVDYQTYNPAIDSGYFPNTESGYYWTSSKNDGSTANAWTIHFIDGYITGRNNPPSLNVRCVRR